MSYFPGTRGTLDWVADQRPKNWREQILYLYPNGDAPLTAMLAKMKTQKTDDPEFYWWTKTLASVGVTPTGIFTDAALTVPYVGGGVATNNLYVRMAEADVKKFRIGHQVLFRYTVDSTLDCQAKVTAVAEAGALSYLVAYLLEDDDNSTHSYTIANTDRLLLIGNMNAEGAAMPTAIATDPTKFYNFTQIFRTPLSITRTALKTHLRTGNQYQQMKAEALEMHSIEMEMALLFGIRTERTGSNGKPERTTMGMIPAIRSGCPAHVLDYRYDTNYNADPWTTSGDLWMDNTLELIARWGSIDNKIAFCGSGALLGINQLAKAKGQMNIVSGEIGFGIKVNKWITPFGTLALKTHPLFNHEASLRNSIVMFEPSQLIQRVIDDTTFFAEGDKQNTGAGRIDGKSEEFLTELGLEYDLPEKMAFLSGVGQDNLLP